MTKQTAENGRCRKKPLTAEVARKVAENGEKGRNRRTKGTLKKQKAGWRAFFAFSASFFAIFAVKSFQGPPCQ